MRLAYYAGASTAAAAACLLKAFHERPNFYSAAVYLSQSNACLLILTNLLLVVACTLMYALQRLLYGALRPIEVEQVSEKAWYAVLDTLLAMPSFREDVGAWLLAMFVLLIAGKLWGWMGEGRLDILEQQPPANPRLFHARLATSLILGVAFDLAMLSYCIDTVMADPRPGMMVIFTFEFAILAVFSIFTLCRYALALVEIVVQKMQLNMAIEERRKEIKAERAAARQSEAAESGPTSHSSASPPDDEPIEVDENEVDVPGWEERRRYLFALEVLTDFVKLIIYIVFFTVSITFNGLPMHIMRDVYMTFASFSKRVSDYVAYRKATSDMNTRYPDATTEEIRGDACIVCREGMLAWEVPNVQAPAQPANEQQVPAPPPAARRDEGLRAKRLPCGHILHLRCLKAWLERQQVCPTCRRPVVAAEHPGAQAREVPPGRHPPAAGPNRPQRRARVFNFGPLRIGFLNGPGNQLDQIIEQMGNNAQNTVQQGAVQEANQPGPNHLGLQVPYLPTGDHGNAGAGSTVDSRSMMSRPIQLLQLEQRLIQDAHNLNLDQRQLATLQMMEAELARLRALQTPAHQAVGTDPTIQRQATQAPQFVVPSLYPGQMMPIQHYSPVWQTLHGHADQVLQNGSANFPAGLALPEGWTLMPLQAAFRPGLPTHGLHATHPAASTVDFAAAAPPSNSSLAQPAQPHEQPAASDSVPRNENGSPLFVPAQGAPNRKDVPPSNPPPRIEDKTPWSSGDGWSFGDENGGPATNIAQQREGYSGKGKGRAVEMEEARDADS